MSFENAFKIVGELVNDFKANEQQYLNPSYSEADVRNDFINKFFIALGWDVRHEIQKNPYEQEVRVEKTVQIARAESDKIDLERKCVTLDKQIDELACLTAGKFTSLPAEFI